MIGRVSQNDILFQALRHLLLTRICIRGYRLVRCDRQTENLGSRQMNSLTNLTLDEEWADTAGSSLEDVSHVKSVIIRDQRISLKCTIASSGIVSDDIFRPLELSWRTRR